MTKEQFLQKFEEYVTDVLSVEKYPSEFGDGLRYAVLDGGKRVRPLGVFYGAEAVVGENFSEHLLEQVLGLACAVELIHSYSLVHDDLPAMDNDDYRRGKLSTHKKFGEANGILIGDMLLSISALLLTKNYTRYGENFCGASQAIMQAANEMVLGQVLDLNGMKTEYEFLNMYRLKTGAMLKCSFMAGAIVAGADSKNLVSISEYAEHLGLAFQIADDLLDEGETNSLVGVIGAKRSKELLSSETENAIKSAKKIKFCKNLVALAELLETRKH